MTEEEFEEIKKSLNFMSEISKISQQQKQIMNLMGEVKKLKRQNVEKDKQLALLEHRVADFEQNS